MAEPPTATNEILTSVSNSLKVDLLSTSTEPPSLETTTLPPTEPSPCFETILPNYIALPQKHSPLLINLPQNHTAHLLLEKSTVNDPPPSASKSKRGKAKDKVYVEVQRGKARVAPVENKVPEAGRSSSEIAENSASVAGVSVPVQLAPCELATMEASGGSVPPSETSLAPAVSFQLPLASFSSPTAIPRPMTITHWIERNRRLNCR
ncbi:hypothetical protein YC2023_009585 [Brassica napus]